ncbi:hypothetical protein CTAYLR_007712 [Chrysophaeum taylorii]|uniref:Protein OSCP1 n=1 Tax=Chrysophaeum taylorii TaxID=2483200 RepID=A0AAD7UM06_9STRA|nr:hypothetical protein CTAYLR_007712 [Chrysophaeum taylorii]
MGVAGLDYTTPLLIVNLGGEMVYILEQRLEAQKVCAAKAERVLCDVVRTMLSRRLVQEMFKAQEMYSDEAIRQIFYKLAHASIMKLNETSMGKLYSLMVMGVKRQLMSCNAARRVLDVTLEHLLQLRVMCPGVAGLIEECAELCVTRYGSFGRGDWMMCEQQLMRFFQGTKIRVSIFLQANLQTSDGTIVVKGTGPLAEGVAVPGTLELFRSDGSTLVSTRLPHPLADSCDAGAADKGVEAARALAGNAYRPHKMVAEAKRSAFSTAKDELDLLRSMLVSEKEDDEGARLELFFLDDDEDDAGVTTTLDGTAQRKSARDIFADLSLLDDDDEEDPSQKNDEDIIDLLGFLDDSPNKNEFK